MTTADYWVVIPAAGVGRRMQANTPKQYLDLCGEKVLSRSIRRFLDCNRIRQILVAVAADDRQWQCLDVFQNDRVQTVIGGAERADSVLSGLTSLEGRASSNDWVLVHDAARPCVQSFDIERMCEALADEPVGGIMAVPIADTIKRSDKDGSIAQTVDRRQLWAAQTPQLFRYSLLKQSLEEALAAGANITDEASALEWAGYSPRLFPGSSHNIKITVPEDIALAEMIIKTQQVS